MRKHLAIFSGDNAELILNGRKSIETRFSQAKIVPYGQVSVGDLVYIKPSGKDIIGQFRVRKVISYEGLDRQDITNIRKEWGKFILADDKYWETKKDSKYGTLIFISESNRFLTSPIKYSKKDLRGWVVME